MIKIYLISKGLLLFAVTVHVTGNAFPPVFFKKEKGTHLKKDVACSFFVADHSRRCFDIQNDFPNTTASWVHKI